MARPTLRSRDQISTAVIELREALGENQQQFANRVRSAITTIARYETSRPPKGKVLAQFARLANEAGRPDLAAVFDRALISELGQVGNLPTPEERLCLDALREIRRSVPLKYDTILSEIAVAMESVATRERDLVRKNQLEKTLVCIRQLVENTSERSLESDARKMADRDGISYYEAYFRILNAEPERYTQAEKERENTYRGTQFDRPKFGETKRGKRKR